ncbi:hypothetical protein MMC22_009484 [Lobaria immixta]|nr:hypothetical protein [Lobaria immixta]
MGVEVLLQRDCFRHGGEEFYRGAGDDGFLTRSGNVRAIRLDRGDGDSKHGVLVDRGCIAAEPLQSLRGKFAAEREARDAAGRCGGGCSAVGHGEIVARRCAGAGFAVRTASRRGAAGGARGVLMKRVNPLQHEPGMRGITLTDLQQASAQQVSPAMQKVSEQQTEPLGMQKGGSQLDLGIQQVSVPGQ